MIKETIINIKIYSTKYYKLANIHKGDLININVEDLPKGSHVKITAVCDICNSEKNVMYKSYLGMIKDDGKYYCAKCRKIKTANSNNKKYGVENVMQLDINKKKMYETNLKKYGCICSAQNDEIKSKIKETCLKKYGVDNHFKSDIIKQKKIQTCLNRYGVENVMNNEDIMNKMINSMFKKYGNYFNYEKVIETKLKHGFIIPDDKLSDWQIYKKKVKNYTKPNKKLLLETWDGIDYYDGEYIKDNFKLNHIDRLYPTVDHKMSIYYGFMNNVTPEEISNINNLCLTKRYINSQKHTKNEMIK